jgi:prepilin-type processing-associated H-X9-DG protein
MKCFGIGKRNRGLTLVEALVVITVIAFGVLVLLPAFAPRRRYSTRIYCASNLKQVGLAFRIWEGDNGDRYPMSVFTNQAGGPLYADSANSYRYFQIMSNEINNPKVLICPDDNKRTAATNFTTDFINNSHVSYFIGLDADETRPQLFLAGDTNMKGPPVKDGVMEILLNQPANWTKERHQGAGNVCLADGSVQQFSSVALQTALQHTGLATNRLLFP